jgi:hypothetical protein
LVVSPISQASLMPFVDLLWRRCGAIFIFLSADHIGSYPTTKPVSYRIKLI